VAPVVAVVPALADHFYCDLLIMKEENKAIPSYFFLKYRWFSSDFNNDFICKCYDFPALFRDL